jgi:hypothetical protein
MRSAATSRWDVYDNVSTSSSGGARTWGLALAMLVLSAPAVTVSAPAPTASRVSLPLVGLTVTLPPGWQGGEPDYLGPPPKLERLPNAPPGQGARRLALPLPLVVASRRGPDGESALLNVFAYPSFDRPSITPLSIAGEFARRYGPRHPVVDGPRETTIAGRRAGYFEQRLEGGAAGGSSRMWVVEHANSTLVVAIRSRSASDAQVRAESDAIVAGITLNAPRSPADPESTARAWVRLIDRGQYAAAHGIADEMLRTEANVLTWSNQLERAADEFGPPLNRRVVHQARLHPRADGARGATDTIWFDTEYANGRLGRDVLLLRPADGGGWKVAGFVATVMPPGHRSTPP